MNYKKVLGKGNTMKNNPRFINAFLLSLILVFTLCTPTVLGADQKNAYQQAEVSILSSSKNVTPTISKTSYTLVKNQSITLKIKNAGSTVSWSSSNSKIASVNKKGKVTAKGKGKATITAKVGSKKLKCAIKVETPKISSASATLNTGKTKKLSLSGNTQKITWSSSNKSIATVSSKGLVSAKKAGTATITAKLASGKTYKCKVTIKKPAVSNTVYITKTGNKYHKSSCTSLRRSKIKISLKDAKARGYTACHICFR